MRRRGRTRTIRASQDVLDGEDVRADLLADRAEADLAQAHAITATDSARARHLALAASSALEAFRIAVEEEADRKDEDRG